MPDRRLVLDANILIRSVLGSRVRDLIARYCETVQLFVAEASVAEAETYLGELSVARGLPAGAWRDVLARVMGVVQTIDPDSLGPVALEAKLRIGARDPNDWPTLAAALLLECPIWTEDRDFFGSGVATWTTSTVEIYFHEPLR